MKLNLVQIVQIKGGRRKHRKPISYNSEKIKIRKDQSSLLIHDVCASRSRNRGPKSEVLKPAIFYLFFFLKFFSPFVGGLPRVNIRVFFYKFFPPFSGGLPRVNTRVFFYKFFFRPFLTGSLCRRRTCPWLIPGFFIFIYYFCSPFFEGCPGLIPGFFFFFQ